MSWKTEQTAYYDQSCKEAEILVTVKDPTDMAKLLGLLEYDKRQDGAQGRALLADFPASGLLRKDWVEPSEYCNDVGKLEDITMFPCQLLFWMTTTPCIAKHRNPALHEGIGIPFEALAVDEMHTMHLGVMACWALSAMSGGCTPAVGSVHQA